jgi:hypothetical protein
LHIIDTFQNDNEVKDERLESIESDSEIDRILSSIEIDRIVNPVSFHYRLDNQNLCQFDSKSSHSQRIFLFVYIHSAPENYMKRLLLRQTWMRPSLYDLPVRFAFFVGLRSNDSTINQAVQLESDHFQDVIQAEFEDSYKNLSLKSLSALHWITVNCNWTRYVLKTDDDAYVNMRALLRHLKDIDSAGGLKPRRLILCRIWKDMHVLRDDIKWGVSREEFPGDFYPAYCSGIAWVMTRDMIVAMDRIANRVKRFWIDDVYITGILIDRYDTALSRLPSEHYGLASLHI